MVYFENIKSDVAAFAPSVSTTYFQKVSMRRGDIRTENIPPRLKSMSQLWWWQRGRGIKPFYYYPYFMYSAGHAELDLEKAQVTESALFKRDRSQNVVITDSSGFQIGTDPEFFDWDNPEKIDLKREKIYNWIDAVADYSITLEAPGWGASPDHKRLKTFDDCLDFTIENLDHYESRKNKNENVRFLHALHGHTIEDQIKWYEAVKEYRHYGFALAAASHYAPYRNLKNLLRMICFLKNEGALNQAPHIHVLGIGGSHAAVLYTYIQNYLRWNGYENLQITFDVSSAFSQAGQQGSLYTKFEKTMWGGRLESIIEEVVPKTGWRDLDVPMGDASLPATLNFESPIFGYEEDKDRMKPKHLQPWSDGISLPLMMAQNMWLQTEMYKSANNRFALANVRAEIERYRLKHNLGDLLKTVSKHYENHHELSSIEYEVNQLYYALHNEGILPPGWRRGDRGMSMEYFMHLRSIIEDALASDDPGKILKTNEETLSNHLGGVVVGSKNDPGLIACGTACGDKKLHDEAKAKQMYQSSRISFASSKADNLNTPFFILSAKYGLISGEEEISTYSQLMDDERAEELQQTVIRQLKESCVQHFIFFKAGSNSAYDKCIEKACKAVGVKYEAYGDKSMQYSKEWVQAIQKAKKGKS